MVFSSYWKFVRAYGIQDGDGKIVYGTYNSSTKLFNFVTNDPKAATPIDINYVFSAVPGETKIMMIKWNYYLQDNITSAR